MFSRRTPAPGGANRLTRALASRRSPWVDLTATNPTAVSLGVDTSSALALLADPGGARYAPDPRGIEGARRAVSAYYAGRGAALAPGRVVLTASSSEAYGWLFKLLCEPGEAVLVPAPSYPLLDALAALEGVGLRRYPLAAEEGWAVDASRVASEVERVEAAGGRVAAVVVVNPNNPTGTSVGRDAWRVLDALAARHGFALVSDEVFLDYRFKTLEDEVRVAASEPGEALVFSLGGLSKAAALPQLKLGWIAAAGPEPLLAEALERLEWIADSYLSVATPVQLALGPLLERGAEAAAALRARIEANDATLRAAFPPGGGVSVAPLLAGWSAVVRVPAVEAEEELVLRLLGDHGVLVHPGYFFEFPHEAFLVASLLPAEGVFRDGVARLAAGLRAGPARPGPG